MVWLMAASPTKPIPARPTSALPLNKVLFQPATAVPLLKRSIQREPKREWHQLWMATQQCSFCSKPGSKSIYRMHYAGLCVLDRWGLILHTWKQRGEKRISTMSCSCYTVKNTVRIRRDKKGLKVQFIDTWFIICQLLNKSPIIKSH